MEMNTLQEVTVKDKLITFLLTVVANLIALLIYGGIMMVAWRAFRSLHG